MKALRPIFSGLVVLAAVSLSACGAVSTPPPVQPTIAILTPTPPPLPPTALPSPMVPSATAAQYAPFCQSTATSGCTAPTAETRDKYCLKKVPYTLVAIPAGATYEVLSPDFSCEVQAKKEKEQILVCTGKMLYTFDLKLCNSACASPTAGASGGQCPSGYVYNAAQQCCAQASSDTGCVTVQIDIGGCTNP